ncbi:MAG: 3-methyl-2-oxobutanoate dehydrogenase subunit VorB [Oscillospiraceae bacterium]|nr:3-methyl-2-oxobutanoate dehydrogenase subunit VorB [Oscillospiraceae bacterium]
MAKVLMKGNEAFAEASMRFGCRFFAGYPITPQSEVLEYLAAHMIQDYGGVFVQTESELSAINMVFGAAGAGARAMTSTSGPGFSLMMEGLSYIASSEIPCVVANVSRAGAGLGEVSQSQGEYWLATRGGGHGDYRHISLAPASVQDSADMVGLAFDLAETYRMPVIINSDATIGQMVEPVELPERREHDINQFDYVVRGRREGEKQITIANVYGLLDDYASYQEIMNARWKRIEETEQRWESVQTDDAEIVLVAYGISSRICKEAVRLARKEGIRLGLIRLITLWPFPKTAFDQLGSQVKGFVSVEMSMLGKMREDILLNTNCNYPVECYGNFLTVPATKDIIGIARDMLSRY